MIVLIITILEASLVLKAQDDIFIRIYDTHARKMAKGYYAGGSDSNIYILKRRDTYPIPVSRIGYIKTRRTLVSRVVFTTLGISLVTAAFLTSLNNNHYRRLNMHKSQPQRKAIKKDRRLRKPLVIEGDPVAWITVKKILDGTPDLNY